MNGCFWQIIGANGNYLNILGSMPNIETPLSVEVNEKFSKAEEYFFDQIDSQDPCSPENEDIEEKITALANLAAEFFSSEEIDSLIDRSKSVCRQKNLEDCPLLKAISKTKEGKIELLVKHMLHLGPELIRQNMASVLHQRAVESQKPITFTYSPVIQGMPEKMDKIPRRNIKEAFERMAALDVCDSPFAPCEEAWLKGDLSFIESFINEMNHGKIQFDLDSVIRTLNQSVESAKKGFFILPLILLMGENGLIAQLNQRNDFSVRNCAVTKNDWIFFEILNEENEIRGYLMGTIHQAFDKKYMEFNPTIEESLKKSNDLYFEISPEKAQTLTSNVKFDTYEEQLNNGEIGVELMLNKMAKDFWINTHSLEDLERVLKLHSADEELENEIPDFYEKKANFSKAFQDLLPNLIKEGEIELAKNIFNQFFNQILIQGNAKMINHWKEKVAVRNAEMGTKIDHLLREGAIKFFALGTIHLLDTLFGPGIVSILQEKKWKVRRMYSN